LARKLKKSLKTKEFTCFGSRSQVNCNFFGWCSILTWPEPIQQVCIGVRRNLTRSCSGIIQGFLLMNAKIIKYSSTAVRLLMHPKYIKWNHLTNNITILTTMKYTVTIIFFLL
jgi:hypothetical protein